MLFLPPRLGKSCSFATGTVFVRTQSNLLHQFPYQEMGNMQPPVVTSVEKVGEFSQAYHTSCFL